MNIALPRTEAEQALGLSLPNRRVEEWRWTDLRQLIDRPYPPRQDVAVKSAEVARLVKSSPFRKVPATRMVFVNGQLDAARSEIANGTVVSPMKADGPLAELNERFATDGVKLVLSGNAGKPIEIIFIATEGPARTVATQNVIEIAPGSSVVVIETHIGEGSYLASSHTEIRIGKGARLDRVKAALDGGEAIHLAEARVSLAAGAVLRDFTLIAGGRTSRQNGTYVFAGPGSDAKVSGAYLLSARQHADTCLVIDHQLPQCTSRELFKCVMDGYARGIFQGKVIVRKDAQKTDGKQSSHGLLLSETAEFDAKPELEIFADDVVCGHGATSGDLDHDQLFYLCSRGIPEQRAKSLLIAAFVGEAFETIAHDGIREALSDYAEHWLSEHRAKA